MSRIVVFGLDHYPIGEFHAVCDRGWLVNGTQSVSGGGGTSITVSKEVLEKGWLQPGRMVLVQHESLPAWAGVIDTPVGLIAPATITLYNAEYLLKMRAPDPDQAVQINGRVDNIVKRMVELANTQEEMYMRMGLMEGSETYREETLDNRFFWDQLDELLQRANTEMILRAETSFSDRGRLYLYMDLSTRIGVDTDFLLHDGVEANVAIVGASMEREIWNRVTGINGASAEDERLSTQAFRDEASISAFRMRSKIQQFRDTVLQSTLDTQTKDHLSNYSTPILRFEVKIMDVGDTFRNLERGNGLLLHASNVVLPDGRVGWRGTARIMAMAYNEIDNTIGAILEARYDIVQ